MNVQHGTGATSTSGCRCDACRQANTDRQRIWRQTRSYPNDITQDDASYLDHGDTAWTEQAACKPHPTGLFFPEVKTGENGLYAAAVAVCETCAVREACADYSYRTNQREGVWGGLTPEQRRRTRTAYMADRKTCIECRTPFTGAAQSHRCEQCAATRRKAKRRLYAAEQWKRDRAKASGL